MHVLIRNPYNCGLWEIAICLKIQCFATAAGYVSYSRYLQSAPFQIFTVRTGMTHVVTDSCVHCRYTDCVDVCPVDCFREGPNFLSIDPDECIDCAVCVAECPVNAIYAEEDVPADQQHYIKLNVDLSREWPSITKTKAPLPEADEWKDKTDKLQYLAR